MCHDTGSKSQKDDTSLQVTYEISTIPIKFLKGKFQGILQTSCKKYSETNLCTCETEGIHLGKDNIMLTPNSTNLKEYAGGLKE